MCYSHAGKIQDDPRQNPVMFEKRKRRPNTSNQQRPATIPTKKARVEQQPALGVVQVQVVDSDSESIALAEEPETLWRLN